MNWLKEIWTIIHNKDEVVEREGKGILKDNTPLGWNIYLPENTTRKEYAKQFHKIHSGLKYKILVPGLILARKFGLPKYQHEKVVPINEYNRELIIFEQSYNQAMEDMATIYDLEYNIKKGITSTQAKKELKNDREVMRHLKTIKQGTLAIIMMDGWYHEFSTFLMHRIYANMAKDFDGQTYNRVLYTSKSIADIHWYIMQKELKQEVEITMTDASKYIEKEQVIQ